MRVIDLTHPISPDMPVYPGTEGPRFEPANSYEADGFRETLLTMYSHTGTHMDPPRHLFPDGLSLDSYPASQFVGRGTVIDCSELGEGEKITMAHIDRCREEADKAEFLLFYTGWDRYWGAEQYFGDYPTIDEEVARYLAESRKKGVGLDVIGLDPIADAHLSLHRIVLGTGETVIIENLTGLEQLVGKRFTLCALPLKHVEADGSPIRAVALLH